MVAGGFNGHGYHGNGSRLDSTEILIEDGKSWTVGAKLPSKRYGLRGMSLPDRVIMTGINHVSISFILLMFFCF